MRPRKKIHLDQFNGLERRVLSSDVSAATILPAN